MKISEMIKNLQEFKKKYGDLECWYVTDDEGNEYHEVYYDPSFRYVDDEGTVYNDKEDLEECEVDIEDVKPICLVN
jgi:hypothetical protein